MSIFNLYHLKLVFSCSNHYFFAVCSAFANGFKVWKEVKLATSSFFTVCCFSCGREFVLASSRLTFRATGINEILNVVYLSQRL